ncbi:thioredoxin domain-containing protein [Candidatus Nomurabacteria bacterium]|nr:thioredoxin domain-containing protein [Candidatus Nomurabacteria bacterium]
MAQKSDKGNSSSEVRVLTIDLQHLLTPIAIILSGIMISTTLFLSTRDLRIADSSDVKGSTTTTTSDTAAAPTAAAQEDTGFAGSSASIGDDPVLGDKSKAKVAIVEFTDYQCPFCQRHATQVYPDLVKNYVDTGKAIIVVKDFPLESLHPDAFPSAIAANCARDLGGDKIYFEYHDEVFSKGTGTNDVLTGYAKDVGLDTAKFSTCLDSGKFDDEIKNDQSEGSTAGVTGTPGFVIGKLSDDGTVTGKLVPGAYPYSDFVTLLDGYLAE